MEISVVRQEPAVEGINENNAIVIDDVVDISCEQRVGSQKLVSLAVSGPSSAGVCGSQTDVDTCLSPLGEAHGSGVRVYAVVVSILEILCAGCVFNVRQFGKQSLSAVTALGGDAFERVVVRVGGVQHRKLCVVVWAGIRVQLLLCLSDLAGVEVEELPDDAVRLFDSGDVRGLVAGDNQRRSVLVDQHVIRFVHDGVFDAELYRFVRRELEIVFQEVESDLSHSTVHDRPSVGHSALVFVHRRDHRGDGHSEGFIHWFEPFGVPLC